MTQRTGGFRAKTRKKLRKKARNKGKISTSRLMQSFKIGERVIIAHEAAIHKGMPHPKFKSKTGVVVGKQGRTYMVQFKDGGKTKKVLAAPVHLIKVK